MIHKIVLLAIIACAIIDSCSSTSTFCADKLSSRDKDETELGQILKELSGLKLEADFKNGTGPPLKYKVAVCGDATPNDTLAGVTLTSQNKVSVLGRVNNTQAALGDHWLMVMLGDGDAVLNGSSCNGSHMAIVIFTCNDKTLGELHSVKEMKPNKLSDPCTCVLEVETAVVCPHKEIESTSHSFLFFSIIFCIILFYFLCGALYRRFALGAKGLEQIPHIAFWSQLFENCGMFCCRRRRSSSSLWHGNEDRDDDSLLQP